MVGFHVVRGEWAKARAPAQGGGAKSRSRTTTLAGKDKCRTEMRIVPRNLFRSTTWPDSDSQRQKQNKMHAEERRRETKREREKDV